ncbi:MAG: ribosomal protein S18-alanine N-acetyltransferase [Magnetospiraceae bacterium]
MTLVDVKPAIESVTVTSASILAALHQACLDPAWDSQAMSEILSMPGAQGMIALEEDSPVGFALAGVAADEAEILAIGVLPEVRGRGIGAQLLARMTKSVQDMGARKLCLEVADDNQIAQNFYQKHKFIQVGRRRRYYHRPDGPRDALVMARHL